MQELSSVVFVIVTTHGKHGVISTLINFAFHHCRKGVGRGLGYSPLTPTKLAKRSTQRRDSLYCPVVCQLLPNAHTKEKRCHRVAQNMGLVSYIGTTPVGFSARDTIKWALPKVVTPIGIHHCREELYEGLATYQSYQRRSNGRREISVLEDGSASCQLSATVLSESTNKRMYRGGSDWASFSTLEPHPKAGSPYVV